MTLVRETPWLHCNAVEPGVNSTTALERDGGADPKFQDRVVAETRALLSTIPA
jgi:hypothetical protein